ncbi:MAG: diaminopimelate decarboxylase [Hadesarchaea archaeon B3_Hades]|nr:MAG: diaminopimelate decarboxylase [Hadesarchaea archaeon B3_Hades]
MLMLKQHFSTNTQGHLVIGGADAVELAERFGTPLYVVDEQRVRENYQRFYRAFAERWSSVLVCYALKANFNLAICKILQGEGAGADVSSGNELRNALGVGIPGNRMVFNGNYKSLPELELAITNNVLINVDSLQELDAIEGLASRLGKRARIGLRVNPDVKTPTHPYIATGLRDSKFGFDVASGQALEAYKSASRMRNIEVVGIHSHIGSQILDVGPFEEEAKKLMALVAEVKKLNINLQLVDLGGGIGIPYKPDDPELKPEEVAEHVVSVVKRVVEKKNLARPTLVFEPGRYIVADSGVLLARVGYTKKRPDMPTWIAVDAGMNALIRPALYGAYHHIELANKIREKNEQLVNVAGPLCESGDFLGKERRLPAAKPGDLAVIFDVGAYGLVMSSQHTAQPRPAMVLVNRGKAEIIRKRESYEDLTRLDQIPGWLK